LGWRDCSDAHGEREAQHGGVRVSDADAPKRWLEQRESDSQKRDEQCGAGEFGREHLRLGLRCLGEPGRHFFRMPILGEPGIGRQLEEISHFLGFPHRFRDSCRSGRASNDVYIERGNGDENPLEKSEGGQNMGKHNVSKTSVALWISQGLLAALFLYAGAMKLIMPLHEMADQLPVPLWFMQFIAVAELLGGIGLIVPALVRILPVLTPLAASGLAIIMVGATVLNYQAAGVVAALFPLAAGALSAYVAYGRVRLAPQAPAQYHLVPQFAR
jgi:hypothetical protein